MKSQALQTIETMFQAFGTGNPEVLKEPLSDDTFRIYPGSTEISFFG
jgi:hypothetical protein